MARHDGANEFGLRIGLAGQWQFAPRWSVNLAGHAGIVHLRTRLKGEDCIAVFPAPGSDNCGPHGATTYFGSLQYARLGVRLPGRRGDLD